MKLDPPKSMKLKFLQIREKIQVDADLNQLLQITDEMHLHQKQRVPIWYSYCFPFKVG